MKEKVKSIYWCIIIVVISLVGTTILQFCVDNELSIQKYLYTICAGVLTSSLATLIIYIGEYFYIKKDSLKIFYSCAEKINYEIGLIQYFDYRDEIEILKKCLEEEYINDKIKNLKKNMSKFQNKDNISLSNKYKEEYKEKILEEYKELKNVYEKEALDKILEQKYTDFIKESKENLDIVVKSYIKFSAVDINELRLKYSDIDFLNKLLGNKALKNNINVIYDLENNVYNKIFKEVNNHLGEYESLKETNNYAPVVNIIENLQKELFEEEKNDDVRKVYKKAYTNILRNLESLFSKINKCEEKKIDKILLFSETSISRQIEKLKKNINRK